MEHVADEYVVYPVHSDLCLEWANIRNRSEGVGRRVGIADSWIAATALLYSIPLATHNRRHFEVLEPNLRLISES